MAGTTMKRMIQNISGKQKFSIAIHIIVWISSIVYTVLLNGYNKILHEIEEKYENAIQRAWEISKEQYFWTYFCVGLVLAIILIACMGFCIRNREELGILMIFLVLLNIAVLIGMLIIYSNPVFTTAVTVIFLVGSIGLASE